MKREQERGFTLPELIVAGSCIMVLALISLFLLRPVNYDAIRRDAKRRTDIAHIMQAINAYEQKHGVLPPHIVEEETLIGSGETDHGLCVDLVPAFLPDLPTDPAVGIKLDESLSCEKDDQVHATGYAIRKNQDGTITIAAPAAESVKNLSITR